MKKKKILIILAVLFVVVLILNGILHMLRKMTKQKKRMSIKELSIQK